MSYVSGTPPVTLVLFLLFFDVAITFMPYTFFN